MHARRIQSWGMLAVGLALGLALGGAMTIGVLIGKRSDSAAANLSSLGELKLKAMASHGSDTFAIATGAVDEEVDGLFTLDYLTGDLQCYVVNPKTGALGGWFKTNIAKDLSIEKGKKPNYLIVTGKLSIVGGYGNQRPAASLCYVADANTGEVACYTFPWAKAARAVGAIQAQEMKLVYKWKARSLELRDQ
jgi:hypothetical protein